MHTVGECYVEARRKTRRVSLGPSPATAIPPAVVQVGGLSDKEEDHWQATYGQTRPDEVGKQVREPVVWFRDRSSVLFGSRLIWFDSTLSNVCKTFFADPRAV